MDCQTRMNTELFAKIYSFPVSYNCNINSLIQYTFEVKPERSRRGRNTVNALATRTTKLSSLLNTHSNFGIQHIRAISGPKVPRSDQIHHLLIVFLLHLDCKFFLRKLQYP